MTGAAYFFDLPADEPGLARFILLLCAFTLTVFVPPPAVFILRVEVRVRDMSFMATSSQ
jgi:hypothetical protein